jgi:hypothetical protein
MPEDIVTSLKEMGVLEHRKKGGASAIVNKAKVKEWASSHRISSESPVDEDAFTFPPDDQMDEEE